MKKKIIIIVILLALIISGEVYLHRDVFVDEVITVDGEGETLEAVRVIKYKEVDIEAFNHDMEDVFKKHGNVGLSIAVFKDDKIIHTFNIGYEDRENGIQASDETKYRIASTSKLIASFGLMRLYDKGLFKIDQPIEDVTGLKYNSDKGEITFIDLLTHTAGIYDSLEFNTAANGQRYDLDYILENSHMNYPVGSKYLYSNFGFGSVGAIIEKLLRVKWMGRNKKDNSPIIITD